MCFIERKDYSACFDTKTWIFPPSSSREIRDCNRLRSLVPHLIRLYVDFYTKISSWERVFPRVTYSSRYAAEWYEFSPRLKSLLVITLYRGIVPCGLTAGKMVPLSMTTYAAVSQCEKRGPQNRDCRQICILIQGSTDGHVLLHDLLVVKGVSEFDFVVSRYFAYTGI